MIQILRRINWLIWSVLLFSGTLATIISIVLDRKSQTLLVGFASVCIWISWLGLSYWLFGLRRYVCQYMGMPVDQMTFVEKLLPSDKIVDVIRALQSHAENAPTELKAILAVVNLNSLQGSNPRLTSLEWRTVVIDGGSLLNVPSNGVFFIETIGIRAVVKATFHRVSEFYDDFESYGSDHAPSSVQVIASSIDQANALVQWLMAQSSLKSIYRGQLLHVHSTTHASHSTQAEIVKRPVTQRDRIVLPDDVLSLAERLVYGRAKHQSRLTSLGYPTRLGLLLYGPPGTGKTLLVKLLLSHLPDHTIVVPVDLEPATLRECFRLATYLEPTIVVIEDVDLLATNRTARGANLEGLQELMNQMDGLSSTTNTTIILTTNRPEVLEPALASRPGRVSQAIEFPLPDLEARRKLIGLFLNDETRNVNLSDMDLDGWAARTEKASPAFLQQLCKRAILLSLERPSEGIVVLEEDMREAMHQLIVTGGKLNRNVLGFPE